MAFFKSVFHGFRSGEDQSAHENRFVKFDPADGTGQTMRKAGAGDKTHAIQMNAPTTNVGSPIEAAVMGGAKLKLGGTVKAGERLKSDPTSRGIRITAAGDNVGAEASADGVIDDIIPVKIVDYQSHDGAP